MDTGKLGHAEPNPLSGCKKYMCTSNVPLAHAVHTDVYPCNAGLPIPRPKTRLLDVYYLD